MITKKMPIPTATEMDNKEIINNSILTQNSHLNNENKRLSASAKITELEAKVDLCSYINESYQLQPHGNQYRVDPCPVCNHKEHFVVYPETNSYYSFSNCCNGGGVYKYLQEVEGLNKAEALQKLGTLAGDETYKVTVKRKTNVAPAKAKDGDFTNFVNTCYSNLVTPHFRQDVLDFFYARRLTINEIEKYKLSIFKDKDGKRALFPIWSKGQVVSYEARALEGQKKKYKKPSGVSNCFFNGDYLDEPQDQPVFLTEGIMDALSLEHLGYKAISINGVNFVASFLKTLKDKQNAQNTVFVTAFDNDEAGHTAAKKLPFHSLKLPEGYKDLNDWLVASYQLAETSEAKEQALSIKVEIDKQLETILNSETAGELLNKDSSFVFPSGYVSENGCLYKMTEKVVRGEIVLVEEFICRQTPVITQSFINAEYAQLYYEIMWTDKGKEYREVVSAGDLAIKKELLKLSYKSLAVTDNNAKHLINYFDKLIMINQTAHNYLVERLGHIKNTFIHPLLAEGVKIAPNDFGERQFLEAFQCAGTAEEWCENLLKPIKTHSRALLMLLASFTSVILKDLKLQPFVVEFSGPTSQGKTTILKVAASVWGTNDLVGQWNLTKVSAERKASFLNSFPLILDDTRNADPRQLQTFVYNFSSGRSKGRGSVSGSQQEVTWNNILISTGENSLNEYAQNAGGVAARIISLTGLPFEGVDFNFFGHLYNSMDKYHGTIGVEFFKKWSENKDDYIQLFNQINDVFQKKAAGNEVVSRIARYYASLVFTANLLNIFFNAEIDLNALHRLFDELMDENKAIDKPKQLLEMVLQDLDADRAAIYYDYEPSKPMKAIFKQGTIYLTLNYLKERLQVEEKATRGEWLRRKMSVAWENNGKTVDYKLIKHKGKSFRCVAIPSTTLQSMGFDFTQNDFSQS